MSFPLELWLVRHGETEANAERRISGWTNVQLTENGIAQAKAVRAKLAGQIFDGVWCSDLQRAIDTALLAYGSATVDARIKEMNFGELEDIFWEEADPGLTSALLAFESFAAPGGEDLHQFRARLLSFVESLERGKHLIFTHGGVIRMLCKQFGLDRFLKNASLIKIDWTHRTLISIEES
ncbi:MAG: histidine phosphatase family protein [Deltaproteobacteria bacterium]|nr:histidine phosphatase family protein [Deltaproteobacteria bacterium]MBN2672505.1 histidine phosphatase family protein [Deltaproteobacteria bacterium]